MDSKVEKTFGCGSLEVSVRVKFAIAPPATTITEQQGIDISTSPSIGYQPVPAWDMKALPTPGLHRVGLGGGGSAPREKAISSDYQSGLVAAATI